MKKLLLSAALFSSFTFTDVFADDCQKTLGDLVAEKLPVAEVIKQAGELNASMTNGEYIVCAKQADGKLSRTLHPNLEKVGANLSEEEKGIGKQWFDAVKEKDRANVLYKFNAEEKKAEVYKLDANNVCALVSMAMVPASPAAPKAPEAPKAPAAAPEAQKAETAPAPAK